MQRKVVCLALTCLMALFVLSEAQPAQGDEGFKLVSPVNMIDGIAPRPLLLVHGNKDDVIKINQTFRLLSRAEESTQLIIVDGADHKIRKNDRAMAIVIDWLKSWRSY